MTHELRYIIAIKLNEREFYPKSLSEWLDVYSYSKEFSIQKTALQEMKAYNQPDDNEIWRKIYVNSKDENLKKLAFEILPNTRSFNKEFISCKNSLIGLNAERNMIIDRFSLLSNIELFKRMLECFKTLKELIFIFRSAEKMETHVDIFKDSYLRGEFMNISRITQGKILEYITSCDYDLSRDFARGDEDKLCLLDLNCVYRKLPMDRCSFEKITEIVEKIVKERLERDFGGYIELYQNKKLCDQISKIVFSRIESSKPTLEELVRVFESTRNSGSEKLRDYSLGEIVKRLKDD